jgi:hypothetical protein
VPIRHFSPQILLFLPDAALNPSAALLFVRPVRDIARSSELVLGGLLYLLIIIPALIIASSLSSQGLSND